ncbi:hypothetical protein CLOLEP_02135 [[Clostridium] leptum DSM 753]|uniref:Uncharacterized protein n=1 Tax=[Clostridium] leptum DSM 753 TaxID=428125 RepID=A7VU89_9FIRM|nr:hypothetical protein CLOLEP_02135 [[Clostridium] leptum DSM 753]
MTEKYINKYNFFKCIFKSILTYLAYSAIIHAKLFHIR